MALLSKRFTEMINVLNGKRVDYFKGECWASELASEQCVTEIVLGCGFTRMAEGGDCDCLSA